METFQTQCSISKVLTMSDRGIRLQLDTQELPPEDIAKIFKLKDIEGIIWVAFKEIEVKNEDIEIPEVVDKDVDVKSKSQTQRAVIYRIWEQQGKKGDFELYYRVTMDRIINKLKDKLN